MNCWAKAQAPAYLTALYLGYGVLGGIGISLAYAGALGNVTRYFPDKRGLATGLASAGNGAVALITAPLAATLIEGDGVLSALRILGVGFFAVRLRRLPARRRQR